jgi:hypothetical protein
LNPPFLAWAAMHLESLSMAYTAKSDEILFHIASQKASRLNVMVVEIFGTSESLASPAVAPQH